LNICGILSFLDRSSAAGGFAHSCPLSFRRIRHFHPAASRISSFIMTNCSQLINIDNNLPAIASYIRPELMSKAGEAGGIVAIAFLSACSEYVPSLLIIPQSDY